MWIDLNSPIVQIFLHHNLNTEKNVTCNHIYNFFNLIINLVKFNDEGKLKMKLNLNKTETFYGAKIGMGFSKNRGTNLNGL